MTQLPKISAPEILHLGQLLEEHHEDLGETHIIDAEEPRAVRYYRVRFFVLCIICTLPIGFLAYGIHATDMSDGLMQFFSAMWLTTMLGLIHLHRTRPRGKWSIEADGIRRVDAKGKATWLPWDEIRRIKIASGWIEMEGANGTIRVPELDHPRNLRKNESFWWEAIVIAQMRLGQRFDLTIHNPPPNSMLFRIMAVVSQVLSTSIVLLGFLFAVAHESRLHGWTGPILIVLFAQFMFIVTYVQDHLGTRKYREINCGWRLPREKEFSPDIEIKGLIDKMLKP